MLEELAVHLGDGLADLVAHGRDADEAESEVLRRLGSPDELATGLMRARQTPSQLLAAAGAGVVAALRSGIFPVAKRGVVASSASTMAVRLSQVCLLVLASRSMPNQRRIQHLGRELPSHDTRDFIPIASTDSHGGASPSGVS